MHVNSLVALVDAPSVGGALTRASSVKGEDVSSSLFCIGDGVCTTSVGAGVEYLVSSVGISVVSDLIDGHGEERIDSTVGKFESRSKVGLFVDDSSDIGYGLGGSGSDMGKGLGWLVGFGWLTLFVDVK